MPAKKTMLTTALAVFTFLGIEGFAQDVGGVNPVPGSSVPPGTTGHTLDELRRGIKDEARRVGATIGEVGREIKEEASHVTVEVAQKFETVKSDVQRMPAHHRVYSRIHWDRSLHDARVEVHMLRGGAVLLRGTVPTEAARRHAVELARGSVDVTGVIDELTVSSTAAATQPAAAPKPSIRR